MGADMCISYVLSWGKMNELERVKRMKEKIKVMTREDAHDFYDNRGDEVPEDIAEIRERFDALVTEFVDCLNCREVSYINVGGVTVYVTGGMSWGDAPTESYDLFNDMAYVPQEIQNAGGFGGYFDSYTAFFDEYKDKMNTKLKEDLKKFRKDVKLIEAI